MEDESIITVLKNLKDLINRLGVEGLEKIKQTNPEKFKELVRLYSIALEKAIEAIRPCK